MKKILPLLSALAISILPCTLSAAPKSHQTEITADAMKAVTKEASKLSSTQKKELLKKLNSGTATDLQTLPGVGPEKAAFIKKSRPFKKVEELANVTGFGQATFAKVVANIKNPNATVTKSTPAKKSTTPKKSSTTTKKTTTPS